LYKLGASFAIRRLLNVTGDRFSRIAAHRVIGIENK
jgi:hypothetical protein